MEGLPFGRFVLRERLAVGGMAELFRAELTGPYGFAKTVAIKKILPALNRRPRFRKMFLRESRIMADLRHGNLVQVYELGEVDGDLFMCLEYVDGCDLARLLQGLQAMGSLLPSWLSIWIVREVGRGLAYLHGLVDEYGVRRSIVHRDVNPHNILLSRQGEVKLGDFGIAKGLSDELQTRQGQIKGKLEYLSPEQARGDVLGPASDLYALGLVLFELLTGQRYLQGASDFELMRAAARPHWRSPRSANPAVEPAVEELVARMLRPEAQARFGSAEALVAALDGLAMVPSDHHPADVLAQELARILRHEATRSASRAVVPPPVEQTDPLAMVADRCVAAPPDERRTGTLSLEHLAPVRARRHRLWLALVLFVLLGGLGLWLLAQTSSGPEAQATKGDASTRSASEAPVEIGEPEPRPESRPERDPDPLLEVDRLLESEVGLTAEVGAEAEPGERPSPPRPAEVQVRSKRRKRRVAASAQMAPGWSLTHRQAWAQRWRQLRQQAARRGLRAGDCPLCDARARDWAGALKAQDEGAAQAAAEAYAGAVEAQRIDGAFIDRKLKRLRSALERHGAAGSHEAQVKRILTEVVDGRFEQANRAINKLFDSL